MTNHRIAIFTILTVSAMALGLWVYSFGGAELSAPTPVAAEVATVATTPDLVAAPPANRGETRAADPTTGQQRARLPAAERSDARRLTALHAGQALAAYRSTFVERCWTPPTGSGPDHIDLRFNLAFDPQGTLVGVGISESRKAFRADVSACIRGLSVKFTVPPPGAALQVQVPLTLP